MTDAPPRAGRDDPIGEAVRRLAHEANNAANAVAVNAEVVRSRLAAGGAGEIEPFARRASEGIEQLTAVLTAYRAVAGIAVAAAATGADRSPDGGALVKTELPALDDSATRVLHRLGIRVGATATGIILDVSPSPDSAGGSASE